MKPDENLKNDKIQIKPIGYIHTPYKIVEDMPIQGKFKNYIEGWIELKDKYVKGLKDLQDFSHAFLIYFFHKSEREGLEGRPFLENKPHGIFAIRSPHRPNHLGLSVIKIEKIEGNKIFFTGVDMLDNTPLIDIKPYVKYFDTRENVKSGWLDKHFKDGKQPDEVIIK